MASSSTSRALPALREEARCPRGAPGAHGLSSSAYSSSPAAYGQGLRGHLPLTLPAALAGNEVGGRPDRFGLSPEDFLASLEERAKLWPGNERLGHPDHQARRGTPAWLAALSELPDAGERAQRFRTAAGRPSRARSARPRRPRPLPLHQTLLATWPVNAAGEATRRTTAAPGGLPAKAARGKVHSG